MNVGCPFSFFFFFQNVAWGKANNWTEQLLQLQSPQGGKSKGGKFFFLGGSWALVWWRDFFAWVISPPFSVWGNEFTVCFLLFLLLFLLPPTHRKKRGGRGNTILSLFFPPVSCLLFFCHCHSLRFPEFEKDEEKKLLAREGAEFRMNKNEKRRIWELFLVRRAVREEKHYWDLANNPMFFFFFYYVHTVAYKVQGRDKVKVREIGRCPKWKTLYGKKTWRRWNLNSLAHPVYFFSRGWRISVSRFLQMFLGGKADKYIPLFPLIPRRKKRKIDSQNPTDKGKNYDDASCHTKRLNKNEATVL